MHKLVCALATLVATCGLIPAAASADGPGVGTPAVVSVGDSAISGEAGRWAGNTNDELVQGRRARRVRLLGRRAASGETIARLSPIQGQRDRHRRRRVLRQPRVHAARAPTRQAYGSGSDFKPGLDFYDDGAGHIGQAKALQQYASTHNVKLVVALIGANNYGFADIVQSCVVDFLTSPTLVEGLLLRRLGRSSSRFTAANQATDHRAGRGRVPEPAHGDAQRGLRRQRRGRWTCRPTPSPIPRGSGDPLLGVRLHAPVDRRLRRLEPRRRLGQRHGGHGR